MNLCFYGCGNEGIYQLKNGNWICQDSKNKCPALKKKNSLGGRNYKKHKCQYCNKEYVQVSLHEKTCYLNPKNIIKCPLCGTPIKDYKNTKTCSHKCANNLFKQEGKNHWNYQKGGNDYRKICFLYHKHICIICNEDIAVEAHHYDENNQNNHPTNFVPLCSNHHLYMHMNEEKYIIKECVDDYHKNFKKQWGMGLHGVVI